ncbi:acyl-CoA thioesterase, partial [Planctomycetota bacterium]
FEWARTEYMEKRGINLPELMKQGILFIVASAQIDYRSPARYGETLFIETFLPKITHASFTFLYKIYEKSTKRLIAEGETKIVTVDRNKKLNRLDPELIAKLRE